MTFRSNHPDGATPHTASTNMLTDTHSGGEGQTDGIGLVPLGVPYRAMRRMFIFNSSTDELVTPMIEGADGNDQFSCYYKLTQEAIDAGWTMYPKLDESTTQHVYTRVLTSDGKWPQENNWAYLGDDLTALSLEYRDQSFSSANDEILNKGSLYVTHPIGTAPTSIGSDPFFYKLKFSGMDSGWMCSDYPFGHPHISAMPVVVGAVTEKGIEVVSGDGIPPEEFLPNYGAIAYHKLDETPSGIPHINDYIGNFGMNFSYDPEYTEFIYQNYDMLGDGSKVITNGGEGYDSIDHVSGKLIPNYTGNWSFNFFIKIDSFLPGYVDRLIIQGNDWGNEIMVVITEDGSRELGVKIDNIEIAKTNTGGTFFPLEEAIFVTVVKNGNDVSFYKNGVKVNSLDTTPPAEAITIDMIFGNTDDQDSHQYSYVSYPSGQEWLVDGTTIPLGQLFLDNTSENIYFDILQVLMSVDGGSFQDVTNPTNWDESHGPNVLAWDGTKYTDRASYNLKLKDSVLPPGRQGIYKFIFILQESAQQGSGSSY